MPPHPGANAFSRDKGITCFSYRDLERACSIARAPLCASASAEASVPEFIPRPTPSEGFLLPSYFARTQKKVVDPDGATPRTIRFEYDRALRKTRTEAVAQILASIHKPI